MIRVPSVDGPCFKPPDSKIIFRLCQYKKKKKINLVGRPVKENDFYSLTTDSNLHKQGLSRYGDMIPMK